MALAFHILAHRAPGQVERLIRAVLRPEHILVLHFDRRAPRALHVLGHRLAAQHPNVILQRPRAVVWSGWQGLHTQLEAIGLALAHPLPWTHFITLSGADFPLQPVATTATQLAATPEASYVSWFDPIETGIWSDARERIARYHIASPLLSRVLTIPGLGRRLRAGLGWKNQALPWIQGVRRKYPDGWPYLGGLNWCMIARPACAWLDSDPAARAFAQWVRHVAIPDEMYFQSTLCSSHAPGRAENRSGHYVEFLPRALNPTVFTAADLPRLLASGRPFARKFDETLDAEILDLLEQHLRDAG
jgi:hypothetical protein